MKDLTEKEAYFKASAYCSSSEHCLSDVHDKLKSWGVEQNFIDSILKRLVDDRYIDEDRYCRFFVNDKFKYNKWGRVKIANELWLKRIPKSIVLKNLQEIPQEDYMEMLRSVIESKKKSVKGNPYEQKNKLIRFALSRGFEFDLIKDCLDIDGYEEVTE